MTSLACICFPIRESDWSRAVSRGRETMFFSLKPGLHFVTTARTMLRGLGLGIHVTSCPFKCHVGRFMAPFINPGHKLTVKMCPLFLGTVKSYRVYGLRPLFLVKKKFFDPLIFSEKKSLRPFFSCKKVFAP